jgi:hypothetical protein
MIKLTDNFVNKKTVDCEIDGNYKANDPLSKGTLPQVGKEQQQGENRTDHQGKTDTSMSDGTQEQSKPGGSFSPTDQNDKMSGQPPETMKSHKELLDAVLAAALKGRSAGDDSPAGQEAIEPPKGDDSPAGQKPIEPPGKPIEPPKGDDSPEGQEAIEPPQGDDSPAGQKPIEPPEGDDSPEDQVGESGKLHQTKTQEVNKKGYKGELDPRRSKGKKQQIFGNDKEGKLPPKKRQYDLREETPERDKTKRYPSRETPQRKEYSDGKKNPKQIRKKRPLDTDTQGGNKGEGSPKEKPELPLFSKRRKRDDLDQYISWTNNSRDCSHSWE